MTREEEIINASKNYYKDSELKDLKILHFINGAKWADNHPKEGLVSIDKVCAYLEIRIDDYIIRDLRKAMEL